MNLGFEKVNVYFDGEDAPFQPGKVIIEPLERGFAKTLGNMFRRIMLEYMPGAAVIGVKMNGAFHEFAEIPGSTLDMTEFALNLKKIRFKLEGEGIKTIRFAKTREGMYYADDLIVPSDVEIMTPDYELISLTGEQLVEFELYIKNGRGVMYADYSKEFEDRPDIVPVDALFSPIVKVGYTEENMRIGQNANFERLILNVTTDGSIHPKDSVILARKILISMINPVAEMSDFAEKMEVFQEKQEREDKILDIPIEHLELSVRAYNCLKRDGYTTVRKIVSQLTKQGLASIHQMGEKSVKEVIEKMKELGFELKD